MVLCMIPVSFAADFSGKSYDISVFAVDTTGQPVGKTATADNANSITFEYPYEGNTIPSVDTGKYTEEKKMAIVKVEGFMQFKSIDEITIDGKPLEVNENADYKDLVNHSKVALTEKNATMFFPVELTKAGYTDTYIIDVTGKVKINGEEVTLTESAKISVKLVNTSEYKNAKTATISKIATTDKSILDAYIVGDKIYIDFVKQANDKKLENEYNDIIKITFKDNNGDLFDVVTWASQPSSKASETNAIIRLQQEGKLVDSAMEYSVRRSYTVKDSDADLLKDVVFELETQNAIYETKEYDVVVRYGITESDPKGIYFAESSKTIKIGEEYTPVVYGVETGKKVDATIEIGTRDGGVAVNAQYVDVTDGETVIGTQEGVAYITASYTTNDGKKYTASSMKITVTAGDVEDDDDDTDGKTYIVTASSLRVRSGAGTNFSQIGSLKNGATVKVESIANGWAKLENGGYVSAQYLAEVVDNGEAQTMYVTARTLNVRKGPGTSYAKAGTLSRGTAVQVVGFSGNWAKLSNGYYVSTSYLAK